MAHNGSFNFVKCLYAAELAINTANGGNKTDIKDIERYVSACTKSFNHRPVVYVIINENGGSYIEYMLRFKSQLNVECLPWFHRSSIYENYFILKNEFRSPMFISQLYK